MITQFFEIKLEQLLYNHLQWYCKNVGYKVTINILINSKPTNA